ncbi:hypothetical protein [Saccharopolyspora spinosa]|uniref:hypothetical protein n=1 Tax=Saccharopolyspora spinosa TaxID=60894 RepID=UPI00117A7464|nr:hypothetical protein [Saccharopolyspora spinosa]
MAVDNPVVRQAQLPQRGRMFDHFLEQRIDGRAGLLPPFFRLRANAPVAHIACGVLLFAASTRSIEQPLGILLRQRRDSFVLLLNVPPKTVLALALFPLPARGFPIEVGPTLRQQASKIASLRSDLLGCSLRLRQEPRRLLARLADDRGGTFLRELDDLRVVLLLLVCGAKLLAELAELAELGFEQVEMFGDLRSIESTPPLGESRPGRNNIIHWRLHPPSGARYSSTAEPSTYGRPRHTAIFACSRRTKLGGSDTIVGGLARRSDINSLLPPE